MISTFTCWASTILVLLLVFHTLGRYHTTMHKEAYEEHKWTNAPPFTLLDKEFL